MKFVIIHGSFGSPESNWFLYLQDSLSRDQNSVFVPKFPVDNWNKLTERGEEAKPERQNLEAWIKAFDPLAKKLDPQEPLIFVGHSVGCLFILHLIERYNFRLDCAIFVSPFLSKLKKSWQIDGVNSTFYKTDFDFKKLQMLVPTSYALYSDNDPYVDESSAKAFAVKMKSAPILVKGAGHMNEEAGFTEFPLVLDLCKTRV